MAIDASRWRVRWSISLSTTRSMTTRRGSSILTMPKPYLQPDEMLGLQRVFPLYVTMDESHYPDIERAEKFDDEGNAMFDKLSEKYYIDKYGTSEAERMLTYAG